MKVFLSLIFTVLLLLPCATPAFGAKADIPQISAQAFALYCPDNGEVILSEGESACLGVASTTKIMTALLCLEQAAVNDKEVTFTSEMTAEGSSMYLKPGDVVKLSDLAAGMMTVSGNDAANAAAIAIGGSFEGFARIMNLRAKTIGMENTNFVTPSGLPHTDHYSTANDMALLMAHAMENKEFLELTAKKNVTVDFINPASQRVTYANHNKLLTMYEHCTGGKTGYAQSTGRCLVTSAEYDGLRFVAVTLNDKNDWQDHISLYEYGFANYVAFSPDIPRDYTVKVAGGEKSKVSAYLPDDKVIVLPADDAQKVETTVFAEPLVFAPVSKGQELGYVVCTLDGSEIFRDDLIAKNNLRYVEISWFTRFFRSIFK